MSRLGLAWVGEDDVNSFKKYNRVAALEMIYSVCVSQQRSAEILSKSLQH